MIEMLVKPKRAERRPWEMLFIGLFYATASFLLVSFIFGNDSVLVEGSGLLLVVFTVISCLPFMYYLIKLEEGKDVEISDEGVLIKEHSKAIRALIWLFIGLIIGFSFWYIILPEQAGQNFNFQIKTFCTINSPSNYNYCLESHGLSPVTGAVTGKNIVMSIFSNNIYVLIFTILFSLVFGAGAIFILVWNATVIAAAIGIFSQQNVSNLPWGILRYMVHGIPEISAYFIGALAGGIISVAVIRKDLRNGRQWGILQDSLILILIAIFVLVISALMEVYLTPLLF